MLTNKKKSSFFKLSTAVQYLAKFRFSKNWTVEASRIAINQTSLAGLKKESSESHHIMSSISGRRLMALYLVTYVCSSFILPSRTRTLLFQHKVLTPPPPSSTTSQVHHQQWRLFGKRGGGNADSKKEKSPNKSNLPEKICVVCGRPFTWRKKVRVILLRCLLCVLLLL